MVLDHVQRDRPEVCPPVCRIGSIHGSQHPTKNTGSADGNGTKNKDDRKRQRARGAHNNAPRQIRFSRSFTSAHTRSGNDYDETKFDRQANHSTSGICKQ